MSMRNILTVGLTTILIAGILWAGDPTTDRNKRTAMDWDGPPQIRKSEHGTSMWRRPERDCLPAKGPPNKERPSLPHVARLVMGRRGRKVRWTV